MAAHAPQVNNDIIIAILNITSITQQEKYDINIVYNNQSIIIVEQ